MNEHLRIAIADDDDVNRKFLLRVLERMGHEVVCVAENGRELADKCLLLLPDLVITDWHMPELDGISAAAEITRQYEVPIILLSGSDLPVEIEELRHVAVLVRRVKPITRRDLEAMLAEVMTLSASFATAT
jgi:CheY-like chemotaxis protein